MAEGKTSLRSQKTAKDRAIKDKMEVDSEVLNILKVDPRAVREKLAGSGQDLKAHHEALEETQDEVEDQLVFITSLQVLNKAMRHRDLKRLRAQEGVMQMFATKCLSTIYAWQLSEFWHTVLERLLIAVGPKALENLALRELLGYSIYAALAWAITPILQWKIRELDDTESKYSRLHAAVDLQAKAFPMVLAWSFKDVVAKFLVWTGQTLWDDMLVAIGVVLLVCALTHVPAVKKAKKELKGDSPGGKCLKNRYLALPYNMLLAAGYAINAVASFLVKYLSSEVLSDLPQAASSVLQLVLQLGYFGMMSACVTKLDAIYHRKKREVEQFDLHDLPDYAIHKLEQELMVTNLGDTLTSSLAFVYGWGVSDTLNVVYYNFFMGCSSFTAAPCQYQQVWYYAIIVTGVLGMYIKMLSLQEYRSLESKAFRTLMITAMSLSVGWAWMNVCQVTTDTFVDAWNQVRPSIWTKCLSYLFMLIFAYGLMVEVYFQILDELRYIKRERDEFHEAYPTIPSKNSPTTTSFMTKASWAAWKKSDGEEPVPTEGVSELPPSSADKDPRV